MFNLIKYEVREGWVEIILNRPDKHNALSYSMLKELEIALWEADNDKSIRAVLISGAGKSFCSGYDLTEYSIKGSDLQVENVSYRGSRSLDDDVWQIERNQRRMLAIFDMHKPVVAKVHGSCIAGGLDLASLCDIVVAADDAEIGFPPTRSMGTPPIHFWLYNIGPQWSKRMLLTGDCVSGKDAAKLGLVLQSFPRENLAVEAEKLVSRMALIDPEVLACNKRAVNLAMELMGARTMQRLAGELDGRGHKAKSVGEFSKSLITNGVKETIQKRDEKFKTNFIELD